MKSAIVREVKKAVSPDQVGNLPVGSLVRFRYGSVDHIGFIGRGDGKQGWLVSLTDGTCWTQTPGSGLYATPFVVGEQITIEAK